MLGEPPRRSVSKMTLARDAACLDERIAKLVVRILAKAAIDAHGHKAWEDFRQD